MTEEHDLPLDDLKDLAEEEMAPKTDMLGNVDQSRELWDVPTESDATLAHQQEQDQEGEHTPGKD